MVDKKKNKIAYPQRAVNTAPSVIDFTRKLPHRVAANSQGPC